MNSSTAESRTPPKSAVAEVEQALAKAIEVIEWCGLNDRSVPYAYGEARPNGDKPPVGSTFNTPREFASWWPDRLRAALSLSPAPDGQERPTGDKA